MMGDRHLRPADFNQDVQNPYSVHRSKMDVAVETIHEVAVNGSGEVDAASKNSQDVAASETGKTDEYHDDSHHCDGQDRIILKVGERRFETLRSTLIGESAYFAACLSEDWKNTSSFDPVDGSCFLDLDPDVFQHVLNYLRVNIFPIFFDAATNAFDYEKHSAVLAQARYLQIPRLAEWVEKKRYLAAVEFKYSSTMAFGHNASGQFSDPVRNATGTSKTEFYPVWDRKKVYVCPRNIFVHRGRSERCGVQCHKTGPGEFEKEHVLKVFITRSEVVYDPKVSLQG